jgi:hypothetical protein
LQSEAHDKPSLMRAVSLLEAALEAEELELATRAVLHELARACRTAKFSPADFPCTASYPYLALAQVRAYALISLS